MLCGAIGSLPVMSRAYGNVASSYPACPSSILSSQLITPAMAPGEQLSGSQGLAGGPNAGWSWILPVHHLLAKPFQRCVFMPFILTYAEYCRPIRVYHAACSTRTDKGKIMLCDNARLCLGMPVQCPSHQGCCPRDLPFHHHAGVLEGSLFSALLDLFCII